MYKTFHYALVILENHLDAYGHVNHVAYFEILEQARWDLVTKNGWGLKETLEREMGPIILEAKTRFKAELILREKIKIETQCTAYSKLYGTLTQSIYKEDGNLSCSAEFKFGLFDLKKRKLVRATPEWLSVIGYQGPTI